MGSFMDSIIKVRFFRVLKHGNSTPDFVDALKGIAEIDLQEREATTKDGINIRLERLKNKGNSLYWGEATKIQTENFPSEVHEDGLEKLSIESPLGYGVAFAFDQNVSVLGMQFDSRIISPSRFREYLSCKNSENIYRFEPILREDAWNRFADDSVKKFKVKVASTDSFEFTSHGKNNKIGESINSLARAYQAPYITIELGVGHKSSILLDAIKQSAKKLLAGGEVQSMKAKTVESGEEIDLMEDLLKEQRKLELPPEIDPDESFRLRVGFVKQSVNKYKGYFNKLFNNE